MSVALGLGLGFFVLTSVAGVLVVGLITGYQNTIGLIRDKSDLMLASGEAEVTEYFTAAERQLEYISGFLEEGEVEMDSTDELTGMLLGALSATPQITSVMLIDRADAITGAERRDFQTAPVYARVGDDSDLKAVVELALREGEPVWGPILWRSQYNEGFLNYTVPVNINGRHAGVLVALVSIWKLSEHLQDMESDFGVNAFVLHGEDTVLAHPLLAFGYPDASRSRPLPSQTSFADPVLTSMWDRHEPGFWEGFVVSGEDVHTVKLGDTEYLFLYRTLSGFSDTPLLIGTYFRSVDIFSEIARLKWAVVFCLIISIASAIFAAYLGRQIARPVRRVAEGATRIYHMDLASVEQIPRSLFRELNDAGRSFNTMLEGLRWFEKYVPKSLVTRLIQIGAEKVTVPEFREVVILFTDIEFFATLSEDIPATRVAEILNEHFTLVARCVDNEGGTVDKYIGDSIMAFWGAPEEYEDSADRACRAALQIREEIEADNARRESVGEPPIRLRIGIHIGRVVVGNIGSPGRINYTVVGDAVNVAERLEELGKTVGDTSAVVNILISGYTKSALTSVFDLSHEGSQHIRGRREHVDVYRL